ncbi:MAG: AIR synthase related protein, partial [Candidatus Bathyarchaeota archaeon]|nr:AIR synthase related protein [Candidatus Bathyarchaeota archaeon]
MSGELGLGKVTREVFKRSVLPYIPVGKAIEIDGATISLTENTVVAHSPSIGVPTEALGFFAFHYAASNVACRFGKPNHLVMGIYLPLKTKEEELKIIAKSLGDEAKKYNVAVSAGQTATYYGLDIPLVTATCMGEAIRTPLHPKKGDRVAIVGEIGKEGAWLEKIAQGQGKNEWRKFT